MKIAITGVTGFIGLNLLSTLDYENNEYICIVREESNCNELLAYPKLQIKKIDFENQDLTETLLGVNVLIHMIGQMGGYGISKKAFENTNCVLTEKMVKAAVSAKVEQLIYLSTPGVQGFGKRHCNESEPYAPRNLYEQTKVQAEKIIIELLNGTDVNYTILRPDFVYGPGDYRRIKMYKNIRDKKFVLTTSGNSYLHPTYVLDVVQGINRSIGNKNAYNEIFNISAEEDISVKEYLQIIADYFDVPLIRINIGYHLSIFAAIIIDKLCNKLLKKDGFVSKSKIDFLAIDHSTSIEKAKKMIGFRPEYNFKTGFFATMKWCEENNTL